MDPYSVVEKKMVDSKKLVPVFVSLVQKKLEVMASAVPPLTIFHLVNLWTLLNAFSVSFAFASYYIISTCYAIVSRQPMSSTDDTADDDVLLTAMLWCTTPQAVAGTLALLLPCHWRRLRRASAYAGLAATVAVNCMWASAARAIIVEDPEKLVWRIIGNAGTFMYMGFDLFALLALARGAGEELLQGLPN